jgi:two-component system response regulator FixJ
MSADAVVYVIDDDEAARESLRFFLESAGLRVSAFASAPNFLAQAGQAVQGCVVTDVRMPEMSGLELIATLEERGFGAWPVVVITGHGDIQLAVEAMKAGASDFLEKPFDAEKMLAAVRAALAKQAAADVQAAERALALQRLATLSGREGDVLRGLVAGKANKVIALELGISPRTVEIYRANVMSKMHAGSLSELVRSALLAGVLDT